MTGCSRGSCNQPKDIIVSGLLRQGSVGPAVKELQQALNDAGKSRRPPLTVDGMFGRNTRDRVVEFQQANGLAPDGIVGPATRAALGQGGGGSGTLPGTGNGETFGGDQPGSAGELAGTIIGAARSARRVWAASAQVGRVKIQAATAIASPGCVTGPSLGSSMLGSFSHLASQPTQLAIAKAAASGIDSAWTRMQSSISVPGLPWYPMFAAFPGPMAPPMPNIPTPLILSVGNTGAISMGSLASSMRSAYSGADPDGFASTVFGAVAGALAASFLGFLTSARFKNVIGSGPIPSYAPPIVVAGPVVNGSAHSAGPCFA